MIHVGDPVVVRVPERREAALGGWRGAANDVFLRRLAQPETRRVDVVLRPAFVRRVQPCRERVTRELQVRLCDAVQAEGEDRVELGVFLVLELVKPLGGEDDVFFVLLAERDRRGIAAMGETEVGLPLMVRVAERNRSEPGLTTLYAVASATANDPAHDSHGYFKERYAEVVEVLAVDIGRRQERGEARSDVAAKDLARLVVAASDGLQLQWLYDKDVDMAEGLAMLIDTLLQPPAPSQPRT